MSCRVLVHSPKGIITVILIYLGAFVLLASCRLNVKSGWTPAAAAFASGPSIYLSLSALPTVSLWLWKLALVHILFSCAMNAIPSVDSLLV